MTKNHKNLVAWLKSHPNGIYIQSFGDTTHPSTEDILDAKNFADGMRKNIGSSGIATVEVSYNKVTVSLVEEPAATLCLK